MTKLGDTLYFSIPYVGVQAWDISDVDAPRMILNHKDMTAQNIRRFGTKLYAVGFSQIPRDLPV